MKSLKSLPPLSLLDQILEYDPETGDFTWRQRAWKSSVEVGSRAGAQDSSGYRVIKIERSLYKAHRLAFYMHHRREPNGVLDHMDGNKGNNKISNLREAGVYGNQRNAITPRHNTSGFKGVSWRANKRKWRALIKFKGRQIELGCFTDIADAVKAVELGRLKYHGEFANHG